MNDMTPVQDSCHHRFLTSDQLWIIRQLNTDRVVNRLLDEIEAYRRDKNKYRQEAMHEREQSESIVSEREQLIFKLEDVEKALSEFVDEHFEGGSKANREDYTAIIPTSDIYKLKEALERIRS